MSELKASHQLFKEIWNAAIEAAAVRVHQTTYNACSDTYDSKTVKEIRKLLK